jgi:hypothetical protein
LGATLIHLLTGISPAELPQENLRIKFKDRTSCDRKFANWLNYLIEPILEKRVKRASQAIDALRKGYSLRSVNSDRFIHPENSRIVLSQVKDTLFVKLKPQKSLFEWTGSYYVLLLLAILNLCLWILCAIVFLFVPIYLLAMGLTNPFFAIFCFIILMLLLFPTALFTRSLFNKLVKDFGGENLNVYIKGFLIYKELFGFQLEKTYRHFQIIDVYEGLATDGNLIKSVLYLQTKLDRPIFGMGLTSAECMWLEQEIKDFLGLD